MIIKNKNELSLTGLRKQVLEIIEAGIERVLPTTIMHQAVAFNPIKRILTIKKKGCHISKGRIFVTGGGKASGLMAETLEKILGPEHIESGVVNCTSKDYQTNKIEIIEASHPIPDERGVKGVEQMLALKERYSINKNDLVICLISGGGSALMPSPVDAVSLEDKRKTTDLLIKCGAAIHEINAVRKHISKIKGGQLGRYFSPARVVSLILSDVIGNDLDVIASGPTAPDKSTFSNAVEVLEKFDLLSAAPRSVKKIMERGCQGEIDETPKTLNNCENHIIGDNMLALETMAAKAKTFGLKPYIVTAGQTGDPAKMAKLRAKEILSGKYKNYDVILIGGETTPELPGNPGKGGRNQHYAAASMAALRKYPGEWVMASAGSDGADYLKDVAGAIVDKISLETVKSKKIDIQSYLDRYDSYTLLKKIGNSLIKTGSTGTNVGDVSVYTTK